MTYEIVHAKLEDALPYCDEGEFDAVLCDPPYGLSFMGKRWDYDVPSADLWRQIVRVLKPGAPVLAFGGTRTYHRLVVGMEDGGLEIRDTIAWIYGSGFPKSQNISITLDKAQGLTRPVVGLHPNPATPKKGTFNASFDPAYLTDPASEIAAEWDGYGTALKPALEPICVARKPLDGTMAANVVAHGVGGLNIDGTRIEGAKTPAPVERYGSPNVGTTGHTGIRDGSQDHLGRWPANVIMDEEAGAVLDAQTGNRPSATNKGPTFGGTAGVHAFGKRKGIVQFENGAPYAGETGGASRFFYCAKANRKEREAGCDLLPARAGFEAVEREEGSAGVQNPRAGAGRTAGQVRNFHPTVKPLDLCRYLATLIRPPKAGKILVPWAGSGSEMIGAWLAGWRDIVGIEMEADHVRIAEARLRHWAK